MKAGWVAAALVVGAVAGWVLLQRPAAPPPEPAREPRTVSEGEGIEVVGQEPGGRVWRLRADRARGVEEEASGELMGVTAEIRDPGQDPVRIESGRARVEGGRTVTFAGGVVIRWAGHEVRGASARYERDRGRVVSPGRVVWRGPGLRVEGKGLIVELEPRVARLSGGVRAWVGGRRP